VADNLIDVGDLFVSVVPVDCDEVLVYTKVEGLFVNAEGQSEGDSFEAVFSFPMYEGTPVQMISYQSG
jgi:hypothetical protein